MTNGAGNSRRTAANLTRRNAERYPVRSVPFSATWLSDRKMFKGMGTLVDISTGGFGACMTDVEAPAKGHLLHARFALRTAIGEAARAIEADARVCGRMPLGTGTETAPAWMVNFAIESIHPVDEKLMARAIGILKTGMS